MHNTLKTNLVIELGIKELKIFYKGSSYRDWEGFEWDGKGKESLGMSQKSQIWINWKDSKCFNIW